MVYINDMKSKEVKPVKLLYIITLSETGGAQKVVYYLAAGLPAELFDITVACAPGGELVAWLQALPKKIEIVEIPELKRDIDPAKDVRAWWKLFKIIKKGNFNLVHCHSSKAGFLGRLAAWLAGVRAIYYTAHGWGLNAGQNRGVRLFYTWAERLAGLISTKVICVAKADLNTGRALQLAPPHKLVLIYNGIPPAGNKEGLLRQELGLSKQDLVIGTVARLAPQKDPLFLLQVAERVLAHEKSEASSWRIVFVLIGDGPLRASCEAYLREKGLINDILLLGSREDAAGLMQDFDVFVLFSRWEGLPLTIIEAMLAGCPVAASRVGGVGELVEDGVTGLLINEGDLAAAEGVLLDLIEHPARRLAMGEAGRERALRMFGLEQMLRRHEELYLSTD